MPINRRISSALLAVAATFGVTSTAASAETIVVAVGGGTAEISSTSLSLFQLLTAPSAVEPGYVPADLVTDLSWVRQTATEPDTSTNPAKNKITGRSAFLLQAAISAELTRAGSVSCYGYRPSNPFSDHPAGRACDFFYSYATPAGVEAGWRTANWLVANQSVLGVKYVIWQGQQWNARSRPGPWGTYHSAAYGCPNPANITGCHYDHVHVSVY